VRQRKPLDYAGVEQLLLITIRLLSGSSKTPKKKQIRKMKRRGRTQEASFANVTSPKRRPSRNIQNHHGTRHIILRTNE
jgi:hypothetical protein